jgi:hypothetical protein
MEETRPSSVAAQAESKISATAHITEKPGATSAGLMGVLILETALSRAFASSVSERSVSRKPMCKGVSMTGASVAMVAILPSLVSVEYQKPASLGWHVRQTGPARWKSKEIRISDSVRTFTGARFKMFFGDRKKGPRESLDSDFPADRAVL